MSKTRTEPKTEPATNTDTELTDELLPDEVTAEPFHLSRMMLRELGGCGPYIRKHRELFPPMEYPDGPVINSATCRRYADDFDWGWAVSTLLDYGGRREVERIADSRARVYAALGRGRPARTAAAFGYVFATRPELRSRDVVNAAERNAGHGERELRHDIEDAKRIISNANEEIERLTAERDRAAAELPKLEEALRTYSLRAAERDAERKRAAYERATAALETLRVEAERAAAAAARLTNATAEATG